MEGEFYEQLAAVARKMGMSFLVLRTEDPMHRCRCGYQTEILEVMAIHQVRQHYFPLGELEDPETEIDRLLHRRPGGHWVRT